VSSYRLQKLDVTCSSEHIKTGHSGHSDYQLVEFLVKIGRPLANIVATQLDASWLVTTRPSYCFTEGTLRAAGTADVVAMGEAETTSGWAPCTDTTVTWL
jgi:hypothetical protein